MPHSYQKEPHHLIITCSMNVLLDITHVILSISISLNHSMNFSCVQTWNIVQTCLEIKLFWNVVSNWMYWNLDNSLSPTDHSHTICGPKAYPMQYVCVENWQRD